MSATLALTVEILGRRAYVVGNSYALREQLKSAGCKWDSDRKQWWIGSGKKSVVDEIIAGVSTGTVAEDIGKCPVFGKVRYKDRAYFVIAMGQSRVRLTVLDGSIHFWASESECEWTKRYGTLTQGYGRFAKQVRQTLEGIRRFIERSKADRRSNGDVKCLHCGKYTESGDDWCAECGRAGYEN